MLVFAIVIYTIYIIINMNQVIKINKKSTEFILQERNKNENYLYFRWMGLLVINALLIASVQGFNMIFKVEINQELMDSLVTIGFFMFIVLYILIHIYIRRYNKFMSTTNSMGIIAIYSFEYTLITMMTLYYIFLK